MNIKILHIILLFNCLFTSFVFSQDGKQQNIDGLNLFPNPVSNGKVYITSKSGENKDISIFDVLGKLVLQITISSKELNVLALSPGVYIIKIKENESSVTRKLIIK